MEGEPVSAPYGQTVEGLGPAGPRAGPAPERVGPRSWATTLSAGSSAPRVLEEPLRARWSQGVAAQNLRACKEGATQPPSGENGSIWPCWRGRSQSDPRQRGRGHGSTGRWLVECGFESGPWPRRSKPRQPAPAEPAALGGGRGHWRTARGRGQPGRSPKAPVALCMPIVEADWKPMVGLGVAGTCP